MQTPSDLVTYGSADAPSTSAQRDLAAKLAKNKPTLLTFYSQQCSLCRSLQAPLQKAEAENKQWLEVARIRTDDVYTWAPEMLHYQIEYVPCFVMLDKSGQAMCKSGAPMRKQQVVQSLQHMLKSQDPSQ